jgi:hypothetical protein
MADAEWIATGGDKRCDPAVAAAEEPNGASSQYRRCNGSGAILNLTLSTVFHLTAIITHLEFHGSLRSSDWQAAEGA